MGTHSLPFSVGIDDSDTPHDVIDAVIAERFAAGVFPAARIGRVERLNPAASLLPSGVTPIRTVASHYRRSLLAEGDGWILSATTWRSGTADLTVLADTDDVARAVLADAMRDAELVIPVDGPTVPVGFWHINGRGSAERSNRELVSPAWADIRHNYSGSVRTAFDRLDALQPMDVDGRVLLLHGPPGTGKTTAMRSLARSWRSWCDFEVVIDAERLFNAADYLMSVLLGDDDDDYDEDGAEPKKPWRLLVLEDCDEMLRSDAKKSAGQALSRLLNVTDGFLGQGLQVMVALSTNEPLAALHPAIARPGRCLAEVHVDKFSRAEAAAWLGAGHDVPADGATLAEMYAIVNGGPVRAPKLHKVTGTYL